MKKIIEDFLIAMINEYPLDQLALLVTWMNEREDPIEFFTHWCELGNRIDEYIRDYEIDLDELLDDAMAEKRRLADEAAQEEYDRYLDLNGLHH